MFISQTIKKFYIPTVILTLFFSAQTHAEEIKKQPQNSSIKATDMKDFERLRKNCSQLLQEKYFDSAKTKQYLSSQKKDGSWPDIVYYCTNRSGWRTAAHITRLRVMAAAWSNPASEFHHSRELGEAVKRGIGFWNKENRQSGNWWWNEIHVPMTLGHIFIMTYDLLHDTPEFKASMPYLEQAKFNYSGQNRIWVAQGVLFRAILTENEKLISAAHREILDEIKYGKVEGIRIDGSFHQHGPQLQFGNYGLSYLNDITVLICYFSDTQWALTQIAPFRDFVINGIKWTLWKNVMDLAAQGRQIWRDTQTNKNNSIRNSIALLAAKDPAFKAEYMKEPVGNKMFFTSDYMIHRHKNFFASYKANSVRTHAVETYINGDNLLGRYFSDGIVQVMRTGNEYLNITSCWEWNRLPGTTLPATPLVEKGNHNPPKVIHFPKNRYLGESTFTGGVSDKEKYGAMIYSMDFDKVKAKKAVFFADDIIIALGSDINSNSPYPVATTVEQSLLNGKVEKGENWFFHNGIGYAGKNISLFAGKRKGNWKPLWGAYIESMPDEKEIFQLTIDHGKKVTNGNYEYAIFPNTTAKKMPSVIKSYQLLANNGTVQAVKLQDNTIMAIFHKGGKLENFTTDSAGAFIITDKKIFAADPTQKKRIFNLTLDNKAYKVKLPNKEYLGSTIAVDR